METSNIDFAIEPVMPERRDFRIGCIGAGFIMRDCHLVAYKDAGLNPQAITSLSLEESKAIAARHHIPKVYDTWQELINDPEIEIVDIAIPPDAQLGVIRELVKQNDHIKGVLCQKPLAMNYQEAKLIVELCEKAGIKLGVNSNMRYDQSVRALKSTIRNKLHEAKLEFLCEPYGGPWRQEEVLPKIDRVMTEFWTVEGKYTPFEVDPTIAAVRKSGQNIIEAEAFTGDPSDSKWNETPEWLKPIGDAAYCAGINRFVLHRFPQQPFDERYKPGATMGQWGTHFDRTQTWWEPGKELFKYWHRCQALLQWGTIATPTENDFIATTNDSIIVKNIHRHQQKTDIYFVANTVRIAGTATCSFGISGKVPEVWDPVTVQMRDLPDYIIKDGQTIIPLKFDAAQSFFIVFRKDINISKVPKENKQSDNFPTLQPAYNISGEWEVQFDPKWGGPEKPVVFSSLGNWTTRRENGIKYYSGTAKYSKVFDCEKNIINKTLFIDLGVVKHLAQVKLNGKDLGVLWCAPWRVAIPMGLLKTEKNKIEIKITNVWANRLIGDEQEPADCEWIQAPVPFEKGSYLKEFPDWFLKKEQRPSKGRYCFTTWNYFTKDSPLVSSGLLGPVRLMISE